MAKQNQNRKGVPSSQASHEEQLTIARAITYPLLVDSVTNDNTIMQLHRLYNGKSEVTFGNAETYSLTTDERATYDSLCDDDAKKYVSGLADTHFNKVDYDKLEYMIMIEVWKMKKFNYHSFSAFNELLDIKPSSVSDEDLRNCLLTKFKNQSHEKKKGQGI